MSIQLKRGTRASINLLASQGLLLPGEPLFITDESRFAVATGTITYQAMQKVSEVKPAFQASGTTGVTYSANVVLPYNTVAFDTLSNYSTSTNRFTASVAGIYKFSARMTPLNTSAAGDYRISLFKNGTSQNGSEILFNKAGTTLFETLFTDNLMSLSVGDYVTVNWTQAPAGATSYSGTSAQWYNHFSGFLIS